MPDYSNTSLSIGWCRDENEKYIFSMYIVTQSDNQALDPKSEEAKKMRKQLDKVFGKTTGYDPFKPEDENTDAGNDKGDDIETYSYNYAA